MDGGTKLQGRMLALRVKLQTVMRLPEEGGKEKAESKHWRPRPANQWPGGGLIGGSESMNPGAALSTSPNSRVSSAAAPAVSSAT